MGPTQARASTGRWGTTSSSVSRPHCRPSPPSAPPAVQLQRQTGDPARTPSMLLSPESKWKNVFVPPECAREEWPERCRPAARPNRGRGNIRIRMGQDEQGAAQFAEIPVQMHRPLPSNGDITLVRLTDRKSTRL